MGSPDPRLDAHKEPLAKATATLFDIIGHSRKLQAAVIRGAPPEEIEALRMEGTAMYEAYLDLNTEAATHIRALAQP